ncbi:hypothetical protein L596_022045 [Steinernema carpocapsae]|nr:hypothetical protein L596_022045 [Steinernema carpocapsae]
MVDKAQAVPNGEPMVNGEDVEAEDDAHTPLPSNVAPKSHPGKFLEKTESTFSLLSQKSQEATKVEAAVEKIRAQVYNSPVKKTNSIVDKMIADLQGSPQQSPKRRPKTPPKPKEETPRKKKERKGSSSAEEELMEAYRQHQLAQKSGKKDDKDKKGKDAKGKDKDKKDKDKDKKKKKKDESDDSDEEEKKKKKLLKKKKQQEKEDMEIQQKISDRRDRDRADDPRNKGKKSKMCVIL